MSSLFCHLLVYTATLVEFPLSLAAKLLRIQNIWLFFSCHTWKPPFTNKNLQPSVSWRHVFVCSGSSNTIALIWLLSTSWTMCSMGDENRPLRSLPIQPSSLQKHLIRNSKVSPFDMFSWTFHTFSMSCSVYKWICFSLTPPRSTLCYQTVRKMLQEDQRSRRFNLLISCSWTYMQVYENSKNIY